MPDHHCQEAHWNCGSASVCLHACMPARPSGHLNVSRWHMHASSYPEILGLSGYAVRSLPKHQRVDLAPPAARDQIIANTGTTGGVGGWRKSHGV